MNDLNTKDNQLTSIQKRPTVNQARTQDIINDVDIIEILLVLLDKAHYIVLFFLLGAVIANAYAYGFIHVTYQSTSSLYMVSASSGTLVDLGDLSLGSSMKGDYKELLLSYPVLEEVSNKLSLGLSADAVRGMVSISSPSDTRILKITATAQTPEVAMNIANAMAEVAIEFLPETMSTIAPNIAQRARLPRGRIGPNYNSYTMRGGMAGAALCIAWFLLWYFLDDTIHTAEDMEKYFGYPPLTTVPYIDTLGDFEHSSGHGKGRRRRHRSGSRRHHHSQKAA